MVYHYTDAQNAQILIALMKAHGIRKAVLSPGTTNVIFVGSVQQDPYFELYSSVDERSAAYIACGLAAESGEPVAISCTGATASRNYLPGLTEAFYRRLPVLAITGSQPVSRIGHGFPQMIDRTNQLNDISKMSINVPVIRCEEDRWSVETSINAALLELRHRGGGPVHINLVSDFSRNFDVRELPAVRKIDRVCAGDSMPRIPEGRIAVFVGAHVPFTRQLTDSIDVFCEKNDAVVLCDQTSNYRGRYRVLANLLADQDQYDSPLLDVDLLIHLGAISGSYMQVRPKRVWRVDPEGKIQDTFKKLDLVFEMEEQYFFDACNNRKGPNSGNSYLTSIISEIDEIRGKVPELPFSNIWCAQQLSAALPEKCSIHFGILNSLRSWNFWETPSTANCFSNTGGFGIDGGVSALLGASLSDPDKFFFGVTGDLAFFYDMNSIGNRHVGTNLRLMVVNNGRGTEFRNYSHTAAGFGDDADLFMAAAGHFGCKSPDVLRHYAEDLGFEYMSASSKQDFLANIDRFVQSESIDRPIIFEIFTDTQDESDALRKIRNLVISPKGALKQAAKDVLGAKGARAIKKLSGR